MNGYAIHNPVAAGSVLAVLVLAAVGGFLVSRMRHYAVACAAGWGLVITSVVTVERLTIHESAGLRMLAIILALILSLKSLVSVNEHAAGRPRLRPASWFLFATCWPGMRPSTFADVPGEPRRNSRNLLQQGLRNLLGGILLLILARMIVTSESSSHPSTLQLIAATALALPALSLIVHFGMFNLLAAMWRQLGGDCHALFRAPLRSTSLTEFWGRRWNLAFSEMAALVVFRPLRGILGTRTASMAAFLFSGLLHELAISVPVRTGYGLPMLYFVLHAIAMQVEAGLQQKGRPINANRWVGRLWTAAWIVLPLPILFHPPFLAGCVWPLLGVAGAG